MSWTVTYRGVTYSSLDLTLDEVEAMENIAGVSWARLNPTTNIAAAKAFLAVFLMRDGVADADLTKQLGEVTLRDLAGALVWVDDPPPVPPPTKRGKKGGHALDPTNGERSSPRGSDGAPNVTDGRPTSVGASG